MSKLNSLIQNVNLSIGFWIIKWLKQAKLTCGRDELWMKVSEEIKEMIDSNEKFFMWEIINKVIKEDCQESLC